MATSIKINTPEQTLCLYDHETCIKKYTVSTAKNGTGEQYGSGCTPRGKHIIRAKIGAHCLPNTVFVGRRATGEIYSPELAANHPDRDWILSRILWLSGLDIGRNRLGHVDTMRRYIYIHGCPDEFPMGIAESHGCIRMRNQDIIELFDEVKPGTQVLIN
ncbi:MAG TPA: L,D-transpeptidase [Gammaproteobacteria bacterium]|nr:L,D-transpeptidase [Gammaproteobacteria bacterium]